MELIVVNFPNYKILTTYLPEKNLELFSNHSVFCVIFSKLLSYRMECHIIYGLLMKIQNNEQFRY